MQFHVMLVQIHFPKAFKPGLTFAGVRSLCLTGPCTSVAPSVHLSRNSEPLSEKCSGLNERKQIKLILVQGPHSAKWDDNIITYKQQQVQV